MLKFVENRNRKIAEAKQQQEAEARMKVKGTLNKMKIQASKLDDFKKSYIEKAKQAALTGNKETYTLAKSGLKICLNKQRFIESMIANFELALQITDMNKVVGEFVEGINLISAQMQAVTSGIDMNKAQCAYEKALATNENQYEALNAFISTANESIQSIDGFDSQISDEEIDKLITSQATDTLDDMDKDIDLKITNLREKIGETN